jgi:hypothetical protein
MEIVPRSVAFATAVMSDWNTNTFRLETSGASTAGPNSIITFNLPTNAVIDLRSFKVHFDVTTTAVGTVFGKLPADTSSLISQCEVYAGGVQISSGFSEYNTACRIKKLVNSSRDRDGSIDGSLSHGVIDTTDAVDVVSVLFKPNIGLFAESSTRYIPTSLIGDVSVRITLAGAHVLALKESGVSMGTNFSSAGVRANAALCTYQITSIHASCATCSFGPMYEKMLLDRLTMEEHLSVNFCEYYSFSQHGITSGSHDVRFSLSASSIDRIYAVSRDSSYQTAGVKSQGYSGANLTDANCSNFLHFKSYNDTLLSRGALRYQFQLNSVQMPQYRADCLDAIHELAMMTDAYDHRDGGGNMITSLRDWHDGKAIVGLQLSMPGQPKNVQSGYSSRGNNTQFSVNLSGQILPAADADTQISATISTYVLLETTAQIRISGARQISISF